MKPRTSANSPSLESKLTAYALAGTAVLAFPHSAKADSITYVPNVNQTVTFDGTTSSPEYVVTFPNSASTISFHAEGLGAYATVGGGAMLLDDASQDPANLAFGALIDPQATSLFSTNDKLAGFGASNFPFDGSTGYLGFYFTGADGPQAGWAEVATSYNVGDFPTSSLDLVSYAYENDANTPITVGQTDGSTAVTPEPSTISLVALGAAGLLYMRRRQHAHAA